MAQPAGIMQRQQFIKAALQRDACQPFEQPLIGSRRKSLEILLECAAYRASMRQIGARLPKLLVAYRGGIDVTRP